MWGDRSSCEVIWTCRKVRWSSRDKGQIQELLEIEKSRAGDVLFWRDLCRDENWTVRVNEIVMVMKKKSKNSEDWALNYTFLEKVGERENGNKKIRGTRQGCEGIMRTWFPKNVSTKRSPSKSLNNMASSRVIRTLVGKRENLCFLSSPEPYYDSPAHFYTIVSNFLCFASFSFYLYLQF